MPRFAIPSSLAAAPTNPAQSPIPSHSPAFVADMKFVAGVRRMRLGSFQLH